MSLRHNPAFVLLIAGLCSLFLLTTPYHNNQFSKLLERSFSEVTSPVADFINDKLSFVNSYVASASLYLNTAEDNKSLIRENETLHIYYQKYLALERENQELRGLLQYSAHVENKFLTTKIVSFSSTPIAKIATIAVGSEDGILPNQIITNQDGVVGKVLEIFEHSAKILLIIDSKSKIAFTTAQSKERAVSSGVGDFDSLSIQYLSPGSKLIDGEEVLTSGEGGVYPSGLKIGTIQKKGESEFVVRPYVRFKKLDYISILGENQ